MKYARFDVVRVFGKYECGAVATNLELKDANRRVCALNAQARSRGLLVTGFHFAAAPVVESAIA